MDSKTAIKICIDTADMVCGAYLGDLTDSEMMHRPHSACNHINWQVGHLIVAEHQMMSSAKGYSMPALPAGMAEMYGKETQGCDDASKFMTKSALMAAMQEQRAGTLKILEQVSEADLDAATGIDYAPTIASLLSMQGSHWMMHAGQWVIVRRNLGKPVLI
jgi:hypothetical protein